MTIPKLIDGETLSLLGKKYLLLINYTMKHLLCFSTDHKMV